MKPGLLVLNAGSSSVKFAAFGLHGGAPVSEAELKGQISGIGRQPKFLARHRDGRTFAQELKPTLVSNHRGAIDWVLAWIETCRFGLEWRGVGHRIVHGGKRSQPALIDDALLSELEALSPLAPHHQTNNLSAVRALAQTVPTLPQVACFDTAFHATQSEVARTLPLPAQYRNGGLQRYGFHGLSYEHVVSALPTYHAAPLPRRLIIAHLGNGASLCAVRDGRSVATTMGFSTLDGLLMGTRCGSLDPGVLLYLMREYGLDETALTDLLYNRCGLLGVSGISADMRDLLASDTPEARLAVDLFCYTLVRSIGSLVAALGGMDSLVFTGGIGEHAHPVRASVCSELAWLGVRLDDKSNVRHGPRISDADSSVDVWVIPANEELAIARQACEVLMPARDGN